jgi:5-epi-alpha-selinene synthase
MRGNGTPGERCVRLQAPSPAVFCPLLPRISPHADEVQRCGLHWATRHGLLERPGAQAAFAGARFANLMSRAHPTAGIAEVALATDWLIAIFALDDLLETALVAEPDRMRAGIEDLLTRLRADKAPGSVYFGRPIAASLADVWRRTTPRVSDEWRARFVEHIADYLHGTVWESGNRARNTLPTVAEHLAMRRHSAATEMFFDLIEPVHGIELPAGVLADEHFRSLRRHAGTVIGLYNDLISWRKEMAVGDLHNIVFIVGRELGLAPADSIGAAVAEHDKQMAAFLAARDALALGPWGADPTVRTAAADVAHWVRGNLDWSFESGRYPAGLDVPSPRRPAD